MGAQLHQGIGSERIGAPSNVEDSDPAHAPHDPIEFLVRGIKRAQEDTFHVRPSVLGHQLYESIEELCIEPAVPIVPSYGFQVGASTHQFKANGDLINPKTPQLKLGQERELHPQQIAKMAQ
jgi:hypothetical protein